MKGVKNHSFFFGGGAPTSHSPLSAKKVGVVVEPTEAGDYDYYGLICQDFLLWRDENKIRNSQHLFEEERIFEPDFDLHTFVTFPFVFIITTEL